MKSFRLKIRKGITENKAGVIPEGVTHLSIEGATIQRLCLLSEPINNLQSLEINCPQCDSIDINPFEISSLEILKIRALNLPVFDSVNKLPSIKSLSLIQLNIGKIPDWIFELNELDTLNLSGNKITSIPVKIINLKKLTRLNLDKNLLTTLPIELKKMASLNHLSIDDNSFSEDEKDQIYRNLGIWF